MAGQNNRSMEDAAHGGTRSENVGWGVGPMDDPEDLGARRALFAVLCTVVVAIGALFMYQSLRQGDGPGRPAMTASQGRYSVQLRVVEKDRSEDWKRLAELVLERYGIDAEAFAVETAGGQEEVAICVGRFKEPDATLAADVVEQCAAFTSTSGLKPFENAQVIDLE